MRHARLVSLVVLMFTLGLGGAVTASAQDVPVWNNATIWQPSLPEAGVALSDLLNQIDAASSLDVDTIVAANGPGPEGPVYAFVVTWAC